MQIEKLLNSKRTLIMGILNVTPDSFSDGGDYFNNSEKAIRRAKTMLQEGADIIDIGGESTRPGSEGVSVTEEINRVIPVIRGIRKSLGNEILISIDTYKSAVAEAALVEGANLINSLGGFTFDADLVSVVKKYNCHIVLYHIKGQPKTMQHGEIRYDDLLGEVAAFFSDQIALGTTQGIQREKFLLDPGIGFGKSVEHNLEMIRNFQIFRSFDLPLLIGVSRKSHLGTVLQAELQMTDTPPVTERLEAALAETAVAVLKGARIVRTHDVLATNKFLRVLDRLR